MSDESPCILDAVHCPHAPAAWPSALEAVLPDALCRAAQAEIAEWPGYAPTPMVALDRLAAALNLNAVHYKDEGARLGLGSFKALGGAYAVLCAAADRIAADSGQPADLRAIRDGRHRARLAETTVVTATDGNHGRSVAWGARLAGCRCRIYVHAHVSPARVAAMEQLGAEVVRIDGDYDASVRHCAAEAEAHGWQVVSDSSWPGYTEPPRRVMAGYSLLADEALAQLDAPPTHLFVQAGVGGLAAAVLGRFWQRLGPGRPTVIAVEPARAACVLASLRTGTRRAVALHDETLMAGLSCGEVSLIAWEVLAAGLDHALGIGEDRVAPAMRALADGRHGGGPIVAGESAVPGLIALEAAAGDPALRARLGLDADSRVLLLGCEDATDPAIYTELVGRAPGDVAAGSGA